MSHSGRAGPTDIVDTYSLLILNVSFRTTQEDFFDLFDNYGGVVDVHIPKDRRTGASRGFAFVRYKYEDEAQRAVERLDGRMVDGRALRVQFAKYGPNAERIQQGRIIEKLPPKRSPERRYRDDYHRDKDYRYRSRDMYEPDQFQARERDYHYRSRSRSASADHDGGRRYHDDGIQGNYPRYRERSLESSPRRSSLNPRRR